MAVETWRSQNSFTGGIISEKMFGRVELEQYQDSLSELLNFKVLPHGGVARRSGTKYVCAVKNRVKKTRVIPFEYSADESYCLEIGDQYIRFIKNGVQVTSGGSPVELPTPYLEAEVFELKHVQSADVMWIVHRNHRPRKLLRFSDTEWYLDPVAFIDGPYLPINSSVIQFTASAATGTVTVTASNGASVVDASADPVTGNVLIETGTDHGLESGQQTTISGIVGTTEANGTWTVSVVNTREFIIPETFVNAYVSGGTLTPSVFLATDVGRLMRIWENTGAKWAWGEIVTFTSVSVVDVAVVENDFPTAATDLWRLGVFSETTGWPSAVMLYETRLVYAGSPKAQQTLDFSQTDKFSWFQTAADETLLATDALSWSLYSESVDNIVWMLNSRAGLAIGTTGGSWVMTGANGKDDPLTPDSVNAKKHTAIGGAKFAPAVSIDNAVIFVDKATRRVYEFAFVWEDDSYRSPDLTILADHLFSDTTIDDVDVQSTKKIYWAVAADGNLYGLTYMRAEEIVAWHKHETPNGNFKSVAVVTETLRETPYFVVQRVIDGLQVQYIEYMDPDWDTSDLSDAYFLDCGIETVAVTTTVSGLDHLEGEEVCALIDGKVAKGLTVSGGSVTLPYGGGKVFIGLNFNSDFETLPMELANVRSGSTIGREKDLGKITLRLTKSYAAKIGRTFDSLEEVIFNEGLLFGTAPELFSGEKSIDKVEGQPASDVRLCVRQDLPLPLTVNSLVTRLLVTED